MASFIQPLSSPSAIKAARLAALLVFPALILGTLGWQALQFSKTIRQQAAVATDSPKPPQPAPEKKPLDKQLLGLFGSSDHSEPEQIRSEALPESNLDLQISAIFFMTPPEESSVIIEDGSKTLILKPGEEARPGIAVAQIESNRVTFKRNGKLEQLSFRGFGEGEATSPESLPVATAEPASPPMSEAPPTASSGEQPPPTAYQQFIQRKLAQNK